MNSSSSSSSDDEYNSDFNIQWIFHFECFHYMKNIFNFRPTASRRVITLLAMSNAPQQSQLMLMKLQRMYLTGNRAAWASNGKMVTMIVKNFMIYCTNTCSILAVKSLFLIALFFVTLIGTYVNPTPMPM